MFNIKPTRRSKKCYHQTDVFYKLKAQSIYTPFMKKLMILFVMLSQSVFCQQASDLFKSTDIQYTWLGIDYSHVKLIGEFTEISSAGEKTAVQIKKTYFPAWNNLIVNEPKKYDIAGMLRKEKIGYDIDMINEINEKTAVEEMETTKTPEYTKDDIEKFVKGYNPKQKNGIGLLFVAETLNKAKEEAYYHFVAIDLKTNKVLIHDRLRGQPGGFGLRNYWAGSVYNVIKDINKSRYKAWKATYASN
jgi:hypothetical protein